MVLASPLVCERVWLDKPKYDAAERQYYERLAQSLAPNKGEAISIETVSSEVPTEQELIEDDISVIPQTQQNAPIKSLPDTCPIKSKNSVEENICKRPTDISVCKKPGKATQDKAINKHAKEEGPSVCSISPKDKTDKITNELPESVCQKSKAPNKQEKPSKKNVVSPAADNVDSISEVLKGVTQNTNSWNSLAGEVAKARQHIKNSLQCIDDIAVTSNTVSIEVANRVVSLEKENQELTGRMEKLEARIAALEKQLQQAVSAAAAVTTTAAGPARKEQPSAPKPPAKQSNDDDDDGVDLFASDSEEEDAEAARIKEQRLAEYAAKKSKKPALIAKSSIILDVKPWDDETDMKKMEEEVRKISTDGLLWGASKLVPLAYGIHKLQINCVVEDEKVSIDWLQDTIQEIEDYVQSVDIAAFNKI